MSYFDHVQCHSCGARMDPEKLVPGPGEMPACPYCGQTLNITDLFGVKDAFVGIDDGEGNDHSLDDLVGGDLYDSRYPGGRPGPVDDAPPPPRQSASRGPSAADVMRGGRGAPQRSAPRALPGPTAGGAQNALIRRGGADRDDFDDDPPSGAPSAADLLRQMKKKR
ncbi:MAG: hypothetical protein H6737_30170 [Alphaproteobacteria bacterium]|nr:hypothetical protein [Alphaproteobacteria bacterium]